MRPPDREFWAKRAKAGAAFSFIGFGEAAGMLIVPHESVSCFTAAYINVVGKFVSNWRLMREGRWGVSR